MKFFWGLVIAGTGVLLLGLNLGLWSVDAWRLIWYLWPLIFVVLGLRFLISNDKIFMALTLAIVLLSGYLVVSTPSSIFEKLERRQEVKTENIEEKYSKDSTKKMKLKLNLGASRVDIEGMGSRESNDKLFSVETKNYQPLLTTRKDKNEVSDIILEEKFAKEGFNSRVNKREFDARLNELLPLDLDINSGASLLDFDFSTIKLQNLKLNAGASSGDIRFGNLSSLLEAKIDTGASKLTFYIPEGVALKIDFESDGLNNKTFADELDLTKEKDNTYLSKDYETAEKKINITIQAGVSSIDVRQY